MAYGALWCLFGRKIVKTKLACLTAVAVSFCILNTFELMVAFLNYHSIPSKIPSNFLDVVGVRWRSMELVYTKKP